MKLRFEYFKRYFICFEAVIARLDRAIQKQKWIIRSSRIMTPLGIEFVLGKKYFIYKVLRLVRLARPESLSRKIPAKPE